MIFLNSSQTFAENGEILFGGAAIAAAVSGMVVPGIMAQSQVNVTQTRSQASLAVTGINAQTQLFQAQLNSQTALAQAMVARDTAMYAQQSQTRDLLSQLQFLAYNRALDNQLAREKMIGEMRLQQSLLELEYKKMELSQILAQTNALAAVTNPFPTPNVNQAQVGGSRMENPLAMALGANSSQQPSKSSGLGESSMGLRRALSSSVSSGSTRKRAFSDLSQFNNVSATPSGFLTSEGTYRRSYRQPSSIGASAPRVTHGSR